MSTIVSVPESLVLNNLSRRDDMYHIEGRGIDLFLLRDFLDLAECEALIELIEADNHPSRLMGAGEANFRTSHSCPLAHSRHPLVAEVDRRISELTGIPLNRQEGIEGQRYRVGQEFRPHFDAFVPGSEYFPAEMQVGGQRTWTVMLALNTPKCGGGTAFPNAGVRIRPKAGNLIAWDNLNGCGEINPSSLHCGEPVVAGDKYIATKWHRQRKFAPPRAHVFSSGTARAL
ncbi:prolyl hydroxylase family protein [Sphingomonas qomolangmaensis]|uniref:2OG-Fe(II) oxygenase n=1 Tax=Sphingomonas qomolangmaensis TaxID=2918765 RepID=A0ABY5L6I6_9SPHN|nr:2OG-Fe(II) oxygenase [Sphingomonas qomolangmaensis]UUL82573.1 2OG-Fe(II) oxygenase [Sphingomonas qomolangmaensis]